MVVNDLSDYNFYEILYYIGFVERNEPFVLDEMIYNNKDIIIADIINRVFKF